MRAIYLDSSAFVKTVVHERESRSLRAFLRGHPEPRVSSALLRTEAMRAVRRSGVDAVAAVRRGLLRVGLIALDDVILDAAGALDPKIIRTLDALHLATAATLGDDLEAVITYDERMRRGATLLGMKVVAPGL